MAVRKQIALSFAQERIWFIETYEGRSNVYNIPFLNKLSANIDKSILEQSLQSIVARHEVLHSLIKTSLEGNGYQEVADLTEMPLLIHQHCIHNANDFAVIINTEINYIFDLEAEYPIRISILNYKNDWYLLLVIHHIACDGWSIDVLLREIDSYYDFYCELMGDKSNDNSVVKLNLPVLSIQYKDFAVWQRSYLSGAKLAKHLNYWMSKLSNYSLLSLVTDKIRPAQVSYAGDDIPFVIDTEISVKLRQLAKELNVSVYSVLLAGFYLLLRAYSNQDDIVVGTPIANRQYKQLQDMIGFFVNSLVLRSQINIGLIIKDYIKDIFAAVVEAQLHQDLPFERLVDELKIAQDTSRHPVFQVMFMVQGFGNNGSKVLVKSSELDLYNYYKVAKFDITVMIDDSAIELKGTFNYATSLFNRVTLENYIKTYLQILKQFIRVPQKRIKDVTYLDSDEYYKIVYEWNKTEKNYPENTIHEMFESQVKVTPNNIAIVYEQTQLTYQQLNQRSNQLAHYLSTTYRIQGEDVVALYLNRSEHMLIAILAVLKLGAGYLPLDPSYPNERIAYILKDANVNVICTNTVYQDKIPNNQTLCIIDSTELNTKLRNFPSVDLMKTNTYNNLIYVLYTSGTTGKPKGVMQESQGCISRILSMQRYNGISEADTVLFKTNYIFDVSFSDIFTTLLSGAKLVITRHTFDIEEIIAKLKFYNVTACHFVPSQFEILSKAVNFNLEFPNLKTLMFSGEKFTTGLLSVLHSKNYRILNYYGPTETGEITVYKFESTDKFFTSNPHVSNIGVPLDNAQCYVLDSNLHPLPVGAVGELYLGGVGLARGYLNCPELTLERFIVNPFQNFNDKVENKNKYLYKTGDLVRYLPGGCIQYLERNDSQVKIRGYRIELGEIESLLTSYPGIKQAVVLVKIIKDSEGKLTDTQYIVGYYVAETKLNEEYILSYVAEHLPEYMVPVSLLYMKNLPLTINGKLDRVALPEHQLTNVATIVVPRNDLEKAICSVYAEVLSLPVEQIGIHDDFFKLGGNSILAVRLMIQLNNKIFTQSNFKVNVASIFKHKTVLGLLNNGLIEMHNSERVIIPKLDLSSNSPTPLSFAQKRLWFIESYEGGSNIYNIPFLCEISETVDLTILEQALQSVVARHEVLHSLIQTGSDGIGYQIVKNLNTMPLSINKQYLDSQKSFKSLINVEVNHVFKLDRMYPLRITIIECQSSRYLLIVIHHIAFDGWSADILLRDIYGYYDYYAQQSVSKISATDSIRLDLPVLDIQYKDFAAWQNSYLSTDRLAPELNYWKNKLNEYVSLNLSTDNPRPNRVDYSGDDVLFTVNEVTSTQLRELAKELGVTLNSVLLSGFYLLLRIYSNQDDIVLGTPVANRNYEQLESIIGFFINSLVLRRYINNKSSIKDFIIETSSTVVEAQLHQELPFEKLVEILHVQQDLSRHPIFQVMFAVQSFGNNRNNDFFVYSEDINLHDYYKIARFDLTVMIDDSKTALKGSFNYALSLFKKETIARYIETYLGILNQLVANPAKRITELCYLNENDYQQIMSTWNCTEYHYLKNTTIHEIFEEQVAKTPNNIAVIYEGIKFTYQEINQKSNQLAHFLRDKYSIQGDDLIALLLDRSEYMLITILAVLKSGAGYVPIDPDYPDERIVFILQDTNAKALLSDYKYASRINTKFCHGRENFGVELMSKKLFELFLLIYPNTNLQANTNSNNLAYIIYTSGTTGNPKGVMLEHAGIINRIKWMDHTYKLVPGDTILQKTPYVFDVSVWELFWGVWYGACTVFAKPEGHKDIAYLVKLIEQENISILHFVPSMLNVFENYLGWYKDSNNILATQLFPRLRYVFCSGEVLSLKQVQQCHDLLPNVEIHNLYGPTEASIDVLYYNCNHKSTKNIYIGKPIHNTKAYILNEDLNILPIGAIGELYIGGFGLARGYLNLPELTANKFISNPYHTHENEFANTKLYKTGDLVRYLPDGNIEYIGRNDSQVKIKGFRIELGEIEAAISSYPGISQAVILILKHQNSSEWQPSEDKYLAAYYVSEIKQDENTLLDYLAKKLPTYMLPNIFVYLDKLPLTINGKLDRKSLPSPEFIDIETYVAPNSELELTLCNIWQNVLQLDKVGVTDDFFRIGGDSILSIRLVSLMQQDGIELTVRDIFVNRTIRAIINSCSSRIMSTKKVYKPFTLLAADDQQKIIQTHHLELNFIEDIYPTSYLQTGMLIESMNAVSEGVYHDVFSYQINSRYDAEWFIRIWQDLVSKHGQLRTCFIEDQGRYLNCIFNYTDISTKVSYISVNSDLTKFVNMEKTNDFDIGKSGVFRLFIQEEDENRFILIFSFHHAITDGWSISSLIAEFMDGYTSRTNVTKDIIPTYAEFVLEEQRVLSDSNYKNFWANYLFDYEAINTTLLFDKTAISNNSQVFAVKQLDLAISLNILTLAKKLKISPDIIFISIYSLVLSRFYNSEQLVMGMVVNNRLEKSGGDQVFGLHLNTIPMRFRVKDTDFNNIENYILKIIEDKLLIDEYKLYPYGKIKSDMKLGTDLYQCAFNYIHFHVVTDKYDAGDISSAFSHEKTNIPLILHVSRISNQFSLCFVGDSQYVDTNTLKSILTYLLFYLDGLLAANSSAMVIPNEFNKLIYVWNNTRHDYSDDKTIHELFEEQVGRTPDNIAVVYEDTKLTYQELNQRSNQLAHYLRNTYQIQGDDLISLFLDRSEHMLIAVLGVLKSGAACVPLDPGCPDERVLLVLEDIHAKVILSSEVYTSRLCRLVNNSTFSDNALVNLDNMVVGVDGAELQVQLSSQAITNPEMNVTSINFAYVIYTSGTTGKPKGVLLEHRGMVNRIKWMNDSYPLTAADKVLQKTPYVFDVSVWELLWGLWYGASVVFTKPSGHKDPHYLFNLIKSVGITVTHFVPSMLGAFIEMLRTEQCDATVTNLLPSLRYIFCSGEVLGLHHVLACRKLLSDAKLHNLYGPTEASIDVLSFDCNAIDIANVYIGKPIDNTSVYVLDENGSVLPIGAIGELYIGGAGLARGYLNQPELTSERFIANPFQSEEEIRQGKNNWLYKSGDLVRYLPDGNIEYIGRNDFQVKIRGFRIELGEIENRLLSYPGISQAVVLARYHNQIDSLSGEVRSDNIQSSGDKYLVGYYVATTKLAEAEMINYLRGYLTDYMIPNVLVYLENLPLTINGKIDRKALPVPEFLTKDNYVAPQNEIEQQICEIYAEVLNLSVSQVGIHDNFFKLGGDSILAIKTAYYVSKKLDVQLTVANIFHNYTINLLAKYITTAIDQNIIVPKAELSDRYPLSFAQERLWFLEQYEQGSNAYHMPMLVRLSYHIEIHNLIQSIQAIVHRHEVLRSLFVQDELGVDYQEVQNYPLKITNITCSSITEFQQLVADAINRPFDLRVEYPIRVSIYDCKTIDQDVGDIRYLLINLHHIASDGWSIDIFQRELAAYYRHYDEDTVLDLPDLPIQYKDFAVWQRDYLTGGELTKQLNYWRERLTDYEVLNLATDKPRPTQVSYHGARINFNLNEELSVKLRLYARANGYTMYSVLLAGFYVLLSKYTNQDDIIVGSPIANRHHVQLQDLIGFFVNMLVQREKLDMKEPICALIKQIHKHLVEAQLHQDISFEKLVEEMGVERDQSRQPLFQILFSVQKFGNKFLQQSNQLFSDVDIQSIHAVTRYDLECFMDDSQSTISGSMLYATSLYNDKTIQCLTKHYERVLFQMVTQHDKALKEYQILNHREYNHIVYDWNKTSASYPDNKAVHQLFEEQVIRTPDHVAIICGNVQFTYNELNTKANQLAHYLKIKYLLEKEDNLIVLCLDRSVNMLVAILAILKSGAAYVPIDPSYPDERIQFIINDTGTNMVLTNGVYRGKFFASNIICLDAKEIQIKLDKQPINNLNIDVPNNRLSYVIYTSGTTGKPKGVMIEHKSYIGLIYSMHNLYFNIRQQISTYSMTNYTFDIFGLEYGLSLLSGGILTLGTPDFTVLDCALYDFIQMTPSLCEVKLENLTNVSDLYLFIGGEVLNPNLVERILAKKIKLINVYGPTETTIWSISKTYGFRESNNLLYSIIGRPLANETCYILNNNLQPMPNGAIGELYIGGEGLARGYLNNIELTQERFIVNLFQSKDDKQHNRNAKLYKTGDLARYLPDGNIEYVGRNDFQVKIRGFRIELSEIENIFSKIAGVKQVCITAKERLIKDGSKYLVAYYVLDHAGIVANNDNTILASWESVYDNEYSNTIINSDTTQLDFGIWKSFITSEAIPYIEMLEWRNNTIARIRKLDPKTILEIGIGSGLLMYPLLESTIEYVGLDLSSAVISRHFEYLQQTRYNVSLFHLAADKVNEICKDKFFDCVILNSVSQYFPNINYFIDVIIKAVAKVQLGGSLFIGDVRNYNLQRDLLRDKLHFEHGMSTEVEIEQLLKQENELLIAPEFFRMLTKQCENLKLTILNKTGEYHNELNKFRYDVILTVIGSVDNFQEDQDWLNKQCKNMYNIPSLNKLSKNQIMIELGRKLPEYMLPNILVEMESLPLNANGKLDRKALPDPEIINNSAYLAPRNDLEYQICIIYAEVLGLSPEQVGIRNELFKLGGDSIISIQIVSKINQKLGIKINIRDIFSYKNIESLYDNVISKNFDKISPSLLNEDGILEGEVPLLPIQQWFLYNFNIDPDSVDRHSNQAFLIKTGKLNKHILTLALNKLIAYHDALRFLYCKDANSPFGYVQCYGKVNTEISLSYLDITTLGDAETSSKFKRKLGKTLTLWKKDLDFSSQHALYKFGYIDGYSDGAGRIYIALHRLIIDSVSWGILVNDLNIIYNQLEILYRYNSKLDSLEDKLAEEFLGSKGSSYRQWVNIVSNYATLHKEDLAYWGNSLDNLDVSKTKLELLIENKSTFNQINVKFSQELTAMLLSGNQAFFTETNDLLLTALGLALSEITQSTVNTVILKRHGREDICPNIDISRTIGWFTTMCPVKLNVIDNNIEESIKLVKDNLRQIPYNGLGFGAIYGYNGKDLPKVSFNYLGQFDSFSVKASSSNYVMDRKWEIIADEGYELNPVPKNIGSDIISVTGVINNQQLSINVSGKLSQKQLEQFVHLLQSKINEIAVYTVNLKQRTYSINDFNKNFETYVEISSTTNGKGKYNRTIFMLPPVNGGSESYLNNITPELRTMRVIAFNNYLKHISQYVDLNKVVTNVTIEFLAKYYIQFIKKLQPYGEYNLFGWSLGGILAFEISRQLIMLGDRVNFLGMVDPYFNYGTIVDKFKQPDLKADITYQYTGNLIAKSELIKNIVLFKATKPVQFNTENFNTAKISHYYTDTEDNHISDVMNEKKCKIIKFDGDHASWPNNSAIVNDMVTCIKECIPVSEIPAI